MRLLDLKKEGARVRPGRASTVQQWLDGVHLATIAPLRIDSTTVQGYRSKLRSYVYPVIGAVRMDKVLAAVEGRRNAARWYLSLGLGLRQGEGMEVRSGELHVEGGLLLIGLGYKTPDEVHNEYRNGHRAA